MHQRSACTPYATWERRELLIRLAAAVENCLFSVRCMHTYVNDDILYLIKQARTLQPERGNTLRNEVSAVVRMRPPSSWGSSLRLVVPCADAGEEVSTWRTRK
jgi:hypothetical protein